MDKVRFRAREFRSRFGPLYWEAREQLEDSGRRDGKFADLKPGAWTPVTMALTRASSGCEPDWPLKYAGAKAHRESSGPAIELQSL